MKKTLLFGVLALLPALSFAQNGGSFQLGVKGGVNLSKLTFTEQPVVRLNANGSPALNIDGQEIRDNLRESFNSRTGTSFGIYTRFGKNLYLQPELMYSTRNASFTIIRNDQGAPREEVVNLRTTNFDVPVLLGLKGGPIRVVAGPVVSFRIDGNQRLGEALRQYTTGTLNDAWAKAYYGYQIGGGLDLGRIGLDVRREGSLSSVTAVDLTTPDGTTINQRLNSWQVTLALRLF